MTYRRKWEKIEEKLAERGHNTFTYKQIRF